MSLQNDSILFYDYGLFVSLAELCTKFFGRVGYFSPWETSFSDGRELLIGHGLKGVERIKYFDKVVDEFSLICFPDCHDGWLQKYFRDHGYRVWGSGLGAELELARWTAKERLEKAGVPIGESHLVEGTAALRKFFQDNPSDKGWFVKVSGFRGLGETWFARDYVDAKGAIDEFDLKYGGLQYLTPFIIEASIPDAKEIGYDGFSVFGQFPKSSFWGIEQKDKSYFGKVSNYDDLPPELIAVNKAVAPVMKELGYCNAFSSELRNDIPIDLTCRHASPAGEVMWEAMENLDEVLFYGAEGTLVEPKWKAKFGAQILLCSEWALDRWQPIRFPEDIREYLKIYNHCRIDTKGDGGVVDFFIPQIAKMKQIGSVVALGDTPEEAVDKCKEIAEQVRGFDLESEADSLDKCVEEMEEEPAQVGN